MKMRDSHSQSGFTLVEIAIVLVIIGLLLGGVLKGQEMIESGRVKNAIADLNGIATAANSYLDRYRRNAGDDGPLPANLAARGGPWAGWNAARTGNFDGTLNITAAQTFNAAAVESVAFFAQLRAAGFLNGNPATVGVGALPTNAFGGLIGIFNQQAAGILANMQGVKVCLGNVPGKAANAIDVAIDDGVGNTGDVRNTVGANNVVPAGSAAAYSEANTYTICRRLQ